MNLLKKTKRTLNTGWRRRVLLAVMLFFAALFVAPRNAFADAEMRRCVMGADMTEAQKTEMYRLFGLQQGDVPESIMSNSDERRFLEGEISSAVIGTKSISSVYLELLPEASGIEVILHNITWCTEEMYRNALQTAGIYNARLYVAAPFPVSGTGGLAGVYLAYEDMTGETLDEGAKQAGTQEMAVTGTLADDIGEENSSSMVNDLKKLWASSEDMTDEEIRLTIRQTAEQYHVHLTDAQVEQLAALSKTLEKLDPEQLRQKVESVQDTLQRVSEAKDQVSGFAQHLKELLESVRQFLERFMGFLNRE